MFKATDQGFRCLFPGLTKHRLTCLLAVSLALLTIQEVRLHTEAEVVRIHRLHLATHRALRHRQLETVLGLDKDRVIGLAELLVAADIRNNLRDTDTHLLKAAEAPALTLSR